MKYCISNLIANMGYGMNRYTIEHFSMQKFICLTLAFTCISLPLTTYGGEIESTIKSSVKADYKTIQRNPSSPDITQDRELFLDKKDKLKQEQISNQLDHIDKEIQFLKGKASEDKKDWVTPTLSLIGVFLGVIAGGIVNHKLQMSQKKFEICKSLMDWKVKQLSDLYGPLYALLHQSSALYRHMNNVLIASNNNKFRLNSDPTHGDFDMKIFQICENNKWIDFRTVTHIDSVYGHSFKIELYFDEIIKIGERMVKIIEERAGYIRDDQPVLAEMFGQYLAHYSVLRKIHGERKNAFNNVNADLKKSSNMSADESAAFPRDIQKLVQTGYKDLNAELNAWGEQGNMKSNKNNS